MIRSAILSLAIAAGHLVQAADPAQAFLVFDFPPTEWPECGAFPEPRPCDPPRGEAGK